MKCLKGLWRHEKFFISIVALTILLDGLDVLCCGEGDGNLSEADEVCKRQIVSALYSFEEVPAKQFWTSKGQQAEKVLMRIVKDDSYPLVIRSRAVFVLGYFKSKRVRTFLKVLAGAKNQNDVFVRRALYALANGFGERVVGFINKFLSHPDPDIRESAIRAMGNIVSAKAVKKLAERLEVEKNEILRDVIQSQIKKITEALKKKKNKRRKKENR